MFISNTVECIDMVFKNVYILPNFTTKISYWHYDTDEILILVSKK